MIIHWDIGMFRKTCEVTLSVLRHNKIQLLSVFETLLYDPIVEWKRSKQSIQVRRIDRIISDFVFLHNRFVMASRRKQKGIWKRSAKRSTVLKTRHPMAWVSKNKCKCLSPRLLTTPSLPRCLLVCAHPVFFFQMMMDSWYSFSSHRMGTLHLEDLLYIVITLYITTLIENLMFWYPVWSCDSINYSVNICRLTDSLCYKPTPIWVSDMPFLDTDVAVLHDWPTFGGTMSLFPRINACMITFCVWTI